MDNKLSAQPAASHTPDGLRQRQRDRFSPRGRCGKPARIAPTVRDMEGTKATGSDSGNGITLWPAPRAKTIGKKSSDLAKKKQLQEGLRKENSVNRRAKREAEDGKLHHDIVPDGGSAGREGRQFTVANVGNNGRIYLRYVEQPTVGRREDWVGESADVLTGTNSPTIRPANQRYPQPSFVFPMTPPSTAGLDVLLSQQESDETPRDSLWTPSLATSDAAVRDSSFPLGRPPSQFPRHKRAFSYSTIDERHAHVRDSDAGAFKIVIERPGGPKAKEPLVGTPTIEVPIPSYKLGTPRFSMRGTAFLRGSSYAATDEMRSSIISSNDANAESNTPRPTPVLSRRHSDASRQPCSLVPTGPLSSHPIGSHHSSSVIRQRLPITPEIFDSLTFKPACDHPSVVRYSRDGSIRAATPARLVAEITSPTFVDYDLLSDFFLTFRSFLDTTDLLHILIARLKWALARDDETGTVVRVRAFVAIRHWVLNYFVDDYVVDYDLRKTFCELLNNFTDDPLFNPQRTKVPLKILGEIKKCWRRVGALYWDGSEFDTELGCDVPIAPGGVAGSRDPTLDPSFWDTHPDGPPRLDGIIEPDFIQMESSNAEGSNFFAEVSRAGHLDFTLRPQSAPKSHEEDKPVGNPPLSPASITSEDFVSCSFPTRLRGHRSSQQLNAHPVPASSIYDASPPIAPIPKVVIGKRARPSHGHKRSGSFSDAFRDQRPLEPVQKVIYKSTELLLAFPYAGSLVRGNLFPPGQATVEVVAPSTPGHSNRGTTLFPPGASQKGPSAMSGPGMKRLLGSVRRALSTRTGLSAVPSSSPTQGSFPQIPPLGVRGATINRLPGTAVVPQARSRDMDAKAPMRIDLLGAEVAEDFKKAVQEEAEASIKSGQSSAHNMQLQYPSMALDATLEPSKAETRKVLDNSEMTTGSKSIVIVDDTVPVEGDTTNGTNLMNTSIEDFAKTYIHRSAGPTPPSTPPDPPFGTPRRSSDLLGQHTRKRSLSFGDSGFMSRTSFSRAESRPLSKKPSNRPSIRASRHSFQTTNSMSLRRYASYHSGFTRYRSERSFDATTFSGSDDHENHISSVPRPLRVLRRRPGGDLRAVTNVEELNPQSIRRALSTGTISTYQDSIRSSYLLSPGVPSAYADAKSGNSELSEPNVQTFSLGALAEGSSPKPAVSLFSTHSSQPIMRPSFEKEAQMLAQIPDDIDDDGGVESALLKLEGKFDLRRSDMSEGERDSFGARPIDVSTLTLEDEDEVEEERHDENIRTVKSRQSIIPTHRPRPNSSTEELKPTVYQPRGVQSNSVPSLRSVESYNLTTILGGEDARLSNSAQSVKSMDSYNLTTIPGAEDRMQRSPRNWSDQSFLRGPSNERPLHNQHTPDSSHVNSFDFVDDTDSLRRIPAGQTMPQHASLDQSFLDSESEDKSDLSSEMSMEVISKTELTEPDANPNQTIHPEAATKELILPSRTQGGTLSPTLTLAQALQIFPDGTNPQSHSGSNGQNLGQNNLPFTPEVTPTGPFPPPHEYHIPSDLIDRGGIEPHRIPEPSRKTSLHLPFTLAFDSQVLAQQFTLIEKDALNEIDWKDLIEMRWKNSNPDSRSWVDFLRSSEPRGVEVVIARFNLVVKWAVSEVVLTLNMEERVRTIIKFIHIAAQCRKYRNFATMTQLTVALTSKDLSRLTKTWSHVPKNDMQVLRQLEDLVTPTSNFYNLRAEMEVAGADQGCIPFVGIYTHDLLVNSERPSQIASTPTTEPLVNFERCRTDATIIKNLLRLLEASQLYRFLPIEGITERCLWLAALTDSEIKDYGKAIQK
ncbi:hypothetical protein HYFRA_00013521 [Hymenoscyphus fraxineus]|uniref:Ras GEF n=1 Tax=Hymenoscyphus fraxineus TaxID=746836 RepID=A0A9N9L9Y3_9HELO|nr:hypothetical protein HYFRA_00013521 [Hymenoscyphus fraxineus]